MNPNNHNQDIIRYREPFTTFFRRRQRQFTGVNYNDRSPEVAAMNAHLRASAYGDHENSKQPRLTPHLTNGAAVPRNRAKSFLHLGRQYDMQARDNFTKEAILFGLIIALSIWPIIHAVQAMAAR